MALVVQPNQEVRKKNQPSGKKMNSWQGDML